MLPHPTTMPFAWEADLQRRARILMGALLFAIVAFGGATAAVGHTQQSVDAPATASVATAPDTAPRSAILP